MCFNNEDVIHYDELHRPLNLNDITPILWNDKCDYIDPDRCTNLNPENYNFTILQHNIRGLIGHQAELKLLMDTLNSKNSPIDILLLCETFLTKHTIGMVNIPGYDVISNHQKDFKGGGTAIVIKKGIPYKRHQDLDVMIEKQVESTFIEIITKGGIPVIIGSMYKPPNTDAADFLQPLHEIIGKSRTHRKKPEIIIRMDHNLDLLKSDSHKGTHAFLELMIQNQLFPSVTRPSRITNTSATLIDNIFISEKFHRSFDSAVLISDISDHLPLLCLVKQTKILDKSPLEFQSRALTDDKLPAIKNKLYKVDWIGQLSSDGCDSNFNIYSNILNEVMDEVTPLKTVRISAKR